jgi:hypothetical protein
MWARLTIECLARRVAELEALTQAGTIRYGITPPRGS